MYQQYLLDSGVGHDANFPTFLIPPSNFAYFKIASATVPLSFYPTGSQNNQVAIRENGTVRLVTIPPGSYNAVTFPTVLQTALGGSYQVTYDNNQKNIKITNSSNFSILDLSGGTTAFAALGMAKYGGESTPSQTFQAGASDFGGTRALLLVSQDLFSKDIIVGNLQSVNALALIDVSSPNDTVMQWENNGDYVTYGREINILRMHLIDSETLNRIDFRGRSFTVQISVLTDYADKEFY